MLFRSIFVDSTSLRPIVDGTVARLEADAGTNNSGSYNERARFVIASPNFRCSRDLFFGPHVLSNAVRSLYQFGCNKTRLHVYSQDVDPTRCASSTGEQTLQQVIIVQGIHDPTAATAAAGNAASGSSGSASTGHAKGGKKANAAGNQPDESGSSATAVSAKSNSMRFLYAVSITRVLSSNAAQSSQAESVPASSLRASSSSSGLQANDSSMKRLFLGDYNTLLMQGLLRAANTAFPVKVKLVPTSDTKGSSSSSPSDSAARVDCDPVVLHTQLNGGAYFMYLVVGMAITPEFLAAKAMTLHQCLNENYHSAPHHMLPVCNSPAPMGPNDADDVVATAAVLRRPV